jgi:predicted TIM-barrel fold metal-dependent hydrolase
MLNLVSKGAWAKVAGADRITQKTGRLEDALPFMRALADAAPQRLVWGSDWPNIGFHNRQPVTDDSHILEHRELDAGVLLDLLARAVPDAQKRRAILVTNPEQLYGFSTSS